MVTTYPTSPTASFERCCVTCGSVFLSPTAKQTLCGEPCWPPLEAMVARLRLEDLMTGPAIAARLGIAPTRVESILHRIGIRGGLARHHSRALTVDGELSLAALYLAGEPTSALATQYGLSATGVAKIISRLGVELRPRGPQRSYPLDESCFDELTAEAAYWIGFAMADGCITHGGTRQIVSFGVERGDRGHLLKLITFLGADGRPLYEYDAYPNASWFSFSSVPISQSLKRYGIHPRKSGKEEAAGPVAFVPSFWRGMIDGDGTVAVGSSSGGWKGTSDRMYDSCYIKLIGSHRICEQFVAFAQNALGDPFLPTIGPDHSIWRVSFHGERAYRLIELLYGACDPAFALDRKKLAADKILSQFTRAA